jgi:hypothetical protein
MCRTFCESQRKVPINPWKNVTVYQSGFCRYDIKQFFLMDNNYYFSLPKRNKKQVAEIERKTNKWKSLASSRDTKVESKFQRY